jgi:hypothetical protein
MQKTKIELAHRYGSLVLSSRRIACKIAGPSMMVRCLLKILKDLMRSAWSSDSSLQWPGDSTTCLKTPESVQRRADG